MDEKEPIPVVTDQVTPTRPKDLEQGQDQAAGDGAELANESQACDPSGDPRDSTQVEMTMDGTAQSSDSSMAAVSPEAGPSASPSQGEGISTNGGQNKNTNASQAVHMTSSSEGDGPAPATSFISWRREEAVKLRMGTQGMSALAPVTVPALMARTTNKFPQHIALRYEEAGKWVDVSYTDYLKQVRAAAKSFIKLEVVPYSAVAILGFNSAEWFIANLGAIFCGGFGVGIYATNSPEAVQYVAHHAQARVMVVENDAQLQKVLQVEGELPHLRFIVQYKGTPTVKKDNVYSWKEFMSMSEGMSDEELDRRLASQSPNKCCSLIYTSGTTGNPKGVMLSHDNLTWTAAAVVGDAGYGQGCESIVSYLPLSHIAAQMLDIYMPIQAGGCVSFAQPDALKGSLAGTLKHVQPTSFFGVPRVWEKIEDRLRSLLAESSGLRKSLGNWARGMNLKAANAMQQGRGSPFGHFLATKLVKKVRVGLGLTRTKFIYSGAAPISRETVEFMASLDIAICEVYGLSETTGPETANFWSEGHKAWMFGSAGRSLSGAVTEIVDPNKEGDGEVCMSGRNVFMGYMDEEEKTKDTFDEKFRFHSGDIGRLDKNGFLFITGRIKELLITAGGENVAPVPIEDDLKATCGAVSNCMLVGDRLKFLSMLICLRTEVDAETGAPLPQFHAATLQWLASIGSSAKTVQDVLNGQDPAVQKALHSALEAVNKKSESRAKKVAKFCILPEDFSLPGGELGPTLKLKRKVVMSKYETQIAELYAETKE